MRLETTLLAAFAAAAFCAQAKTQERLETFDAPTGKSVTWKRLNALDPGLKEIGRLATCDAKDIKGNSWSVGCETLDRDYAKWETMKKYVARTGAKHGRLFSGWAKTEKKKGVYDFTWLDAPVREMAALGVKPWICLSYGNPVYGGDYRLGMKVRDVTGSPEAFGAWLKYCAACVERYKDIVDEWEIWNEPFNQGEDYAELYLRTARMIRTIQPEAKIYCTAIAYPKDYTCLLERLKKENALDLASYFIYHPYDPNPDTSWCTRAEPLRRLVKRYRGSFDIMQGEAGCPAQLEYSHALRGHEWNEYSQAKWFLRRAIGDAAHAIPSGCFTLVDLNYGFMLQSFGLVRCDNYNRPMYERPAFHAIRNVYSFLSSEAHPEAFHEDVPFKMLERFDTRAKGRRKMTAVRFSRYSMPIRFYWFAEDEPSGQLGFDRIRMWLPGRHKSLVWVDMITGRVFEIPESRLSREKDRTWIEDAPMWDSPIMIAPRGAVPLAYDWKKETPYAIADSFYRPGQFSHWMKGLPPDGTEPWMKMKTADFLPCFDRYGQFKHREWSGKTHCDADLKADAEAEERDLAAHPGPADRDRFGGWASGPALAPAKRFRAEKVDGRWWLVDPDGRLFWSLGVMRVSASSAMTPMNGDTGKPHRGIPIPDRDCFFEDLPPQPGVPDATAFSKFWTTRDELLYPFFAARGETRIYDFSSANLFRKYGPDYYERFTDIVHRRLASWGVNTLSSSSDIAICLKDRTPYIERLERQSRPIEASYGEWWKFRDPWDASFKSSVKALLEERSAQASDPWCIGFSVDNEIDWGGRKSKLAEWTIQSPADQPAKIALVGFLKAKYGSAAALNAAWGKDYADWDDVLHSTLPPGPKATPDLEAFTLEIVENYFRRTREAIKEFDPGLMYLGCRFAGGGAAPWVVEAAGRWCDVVTFNVYRDSLATWKIPENLDRPVLITEFHFGANDAGNFGTGVCKAKDRKDRAEKMAAYVRAVLAMPQVVGCHWHQFSDQACSGRFDGEGITVGWTDVCDKPYKETVDALREISRDLYRRFMIQSPGNVR